MMTVAARSASAPREVSFVCRGLVHVGNLSGFSLSNFNKDFMRAMLRSVFGAMPVRVMALRVCNNPFVFRIVFAFVSPFFPKKMKERMKVLGSEYDDGLAEVLPRESIPEALGGGLKVVGDDGDVDM